MVMRQRVEEEDDDDESDDDEPEKQTKPTMGSNPKH